MTTSAMTFRNELKERLVDFVWQQWCRLGVSGASRKGSDRVIDPEVLLAFTSEIGRYDARLFDEVLDWLATNGSWINTQRVSTIMKQDGIGCPNVLGAMAAWMCDRDKSVKWRGIAKRYQPDAQDSTEHLFRAVPYGSMPMFEEPDVHFKQYGLMRESVQTRGMTQAVNMADPANVIFRSRALFGISIRADIFAYLLTTEGGHARRIAVLLGFNHMRVQSVLTALANAGYVAVRSEGRSKNYWIDRERWGHVIFPNETAPSQWVNWRPLARGLTAMWREAWSLDEARADKYIVSSKMRAVMKTVRDDLLASGIDFDIVDDRNYVAEDYLPIFERDIAGILDAMTG